MKYRITKREGFRVFGVYTNIRNDLEVAFEQVPQFFRKCDEELVPDEINAILGRFNDNLQYLKFQPKHGLCLMYQIKIFRLFGNEFGRSGFQHQAMRLYKEFSLRCTMV